MKKEIKGWTNIYLPEGVHVMPINDIIDHELEDCACMPETEVVEADDGSIGWVISHFAWDGRE